MTYFCRVLGVLFFSCTIAYAQPSTGSIRQAIQTIIQQSDEDVNLGVMVMRLSDGSVLYERHPDRYFTPASNVKLFTSYAALRTLGKDYVFKTTLAANYQSIEKDTLHGNLYLTFTGDPDFTFDDLEKLFVTLKEIYGVAQISGKLFVDDSAFDEDYWVEGSGWDDQKFYYGTAVSPIVINHNTHQAILIPGEQEGQKPSLISEKPMLLNMVVNEVETRQLDDPKACPLELKEIGENAYKIIGCVEPGSKSIPLRIGIKQPRVMLKKLLHMVTMKHHIRIDEGIHFGALSEKVMPLATHDSQPISRLLADMQRESDNMIANVLFKTFGRVTTNSQGSFAMGRRVMEALFDKEESLNSEHIKIVDGAGASRYNLVTPRELSQLLKLAYADNDIRDVFLETLPQGGEGLLSTRLMDVAFKDKIRVKTGSMASVSALSGYVKHPKEGMLAFVILNNGFLAMKKQKELEDKIVTYLITGRY